MSELKLPAASGGGSISIKGPASSSSDVDLLDTSGNLKLSDSDELRLGTGDDLKLYHDGSNTYIDNATGDLKIRGDNIRFRSKSVDEMQISTYVNGAVQMAYDGSMKFETISTGVNVTGGVRLGGNNAANELDDYEEGTWGSFNGNAISSGTISYGVYTKIGNLVHVQAKVGSMTVGTGSSAVELTLPFAVDSNYNDSAGSVFYQYVDTGGKDVCSYGYDSILRMYRMSDDGNWTVLIGDYMNSGGTTNFIVNHTYFTAA